MKKNKITIIGSINADLVIGVERMALAGETLLGGDMRMFPGGKGGNQAVAASRLGASVVMVGRIGDDVWGRELLANLKKSGVNITYVTKDENAPTGIAMIMIDKHGENTIIVAPGANMKMTTRDIDKAKNSIRRSKVVLLQREIPIAVIRHAVRMAYKYKVKVILDPGPVGPCPSSLRRVLLLKT